MIRFVHHSVVVVVLVWAAATRGAAPASAWVASGFARRTIYHSPQKPGYTAWAGAWPMPDGSLMVSFTQATGPLKGRPAADAALRQRMGIPAGYDFTGLELRQVYLRSVDGGEHWSTAASTPFHSIGASAYAGGATTALPDGAILRRVNGWDLMDDPSVPHTAFLQRSTDGARTWGSPQALLDPARLTCQVSRIRLLSDGRLLATGQVWRVPAGSSRADLEHAPIDLLVMTSSDGGKSWQRHAVVPPEFPPVAWDEWDSAELAGGDLLCVFRRGDPENPRKEVRWQGVLVRKGAGWRLERFEPCAFPHSGHPELLATREGIVLHIATSGIHWTADAGRTWTALPVPGFAGLYHSRYYPRSLQAADGRIFIFAHNGSDNRYGEVDQSIVMDVFRLRRAR